MADNHGAAEPHVVPPLESSLPPPNDKLVTEESPVEIPVTTSNPAMSSSGEVGSATQPPEVGDQKQSGLTAASKKRKRRIRYKRNKRTLPRTGDDGTRSTSKSRELTTESTPGVTTTDENKDDERDDDEETTSSEVENSCPTVTWDSNAETIAVLSEIDHMPGEESCHSTTSDPAIVQVDADIPSSLSGHYPDFSNGTRTPPHSNEEDVDLAGTVSGSRHQNPIEVVVEVVIPALRQQAKTETTQITLGEEITFPISTSNEDEDSLKNNSGIIKVEDNKNHFLCTEQPSASSPPISNADITTHEEMIPRNATPSQEELAYNATTTTTEGHAGDDDGKISASKPVESVTESTFGGATTKDNKADDRDDGEETTFSQPENSFPTMPWDSLKFSAETIAVMNEIDQMLDEEESHHSTASDHVLLQVDADVVSSLSGHYPDFSSGTDWTSHSNDEDVEWVGTVNSLHRPIEVVVVDQIPALQEQQEIECAMQEQDDDQETETACPGRNTCLRNEAFGSVSAIFDTTAEQQDQDNFEIMEHRREQGEDNLLFNLSRAIKMSYPRTTRVTLGEEVSISTLNDVEDSFKPKSSAIEPTPAENNNPRFDIAEQPLPSSLIGNDDATNLDVITPSKEELESISSATIASTISVCHPEQLKELSPQPNIVALSEGDHDDQYLVSESESEFGGCCAALRRGRSRPWNKKDATNTGEGSSSRPGSMGGKRISFKERSASLKMRLSKVFFKGGPPTKE